MFAEIQALLQGLKFMWNHNWRKATCGVDCLEFVQALGKQQTVFHQYSSYLMDIQLLLSCNWDVNIFHVPREGNEPVDLLAGTGVRLQCVLTELENPPYEILPLLLRDLGPV